MNHLQVATEVVIAATSRGIQADYNSLLRVESADNEFVRAPRMRLKIYETKKQTLTRMLRSYQATAPDPIPPEPPTTAVAQQPAISGTSAVPPPAISGTSERVWAAQEAYKQQSGLFPHPQLPQQLTGTRHRRGPPNETKTSPSFFWQCCHEEVLFAREPLGCADLVRRFKERCDILGLRETTGHQNWLKTYNELLLVLYSAAEIKVGTHHTNAIGLLEAIWRKHGKEVLAELADWFKAQANDITGAAGRRVDDAVLLSAVRHIQSKIPALLAAERKRTQRTCTASLNASCQTKDSMRNIPAWLLVRMQT